MNYLILLNRKYPYKSGEAFLENEIDEIASSFDKVLIYPSDVTELDNMTRTIKSPNVTVRILESEENQKKQIRYGLKSFRYIKSCTSKGLIRKMIEGYFLAAADSQANKIISDLEVSDITTGDRLFVYSYWFYINAKVACIIKNYFKNKKVEVVAFSRAHRFDIYEENRKFNFLPQRVELLSELNHVYACSDNGSDYLRTKYRDFEKKISTAYLGTYDHGIEQYERASTLRIVSCSRMSNVKRVHLIVEALAILKEMGVSIEWTHIGGGELYKDIETEVKSKLQGVKVNLKGSIANKDVYEFYIENSVDVFINVSSSEGLPVSIMEAISFGIPVIATDVGGTGEIVITGVSGVLVEPNISSKTLADNINCFAEMENESYMKLRRTTRKLWEQKYQAKDNYKIFSDNIKKLMLE